MTEADKNIKEQKVKISKLAILSLIMPIILFIIGVITLHILIISSPIIGIFLGVWALILIKKSSGKLKGIGFAISGIIFSLIFIILFISWTYCFYMAVMYEKPYNDSNPKAIIAKVEKVCDINFPEKIESLKAAEKIAAGIDPAYTFIARFTTDPNSFAKLRNLLSKTEYYSEEITDELLTKDGRSYTYGSRIDVQDVCFWQKNAPEWFNAEIPKGKVYELQSSGKMMLYFICVELPDSNDVVVNIQGLCLGRELSRKLMNQEDVNNLKGL